MTDDLAQLLRSLRLKKIAEVLDAELRRAEQEDASSQDVLARLLRAQGQANQENALAWRIERARLPEQWTLETFPFKQQPGVNATQIRAFAALDFIPRAENIVFVGPPGVGKTGLASGLLLRALQNGHRGLFMRAQDLFDEMYASLADRSTRRLLTRLARVDVLVVDEMGYLNLRPEQTNIFFKLMEERYRQRPTIITVNHRWDSRSRELFDLVPAAGYWRRSAAGRGGVGAWARRGDRRRRARSRRHGRRAARRGRGSPGRRGTR